MNNGHALIASERCVAADLSALKGFRDVALTSFLVGFRYGGSWPESTSGYRRALLAKYVSLSLRTL